MDDSNQPNNTPDDVRPDENNDVLSGAQSIEASFGGVSVNADVNLQKETEEPKEPVKGDVSPEKADEAVEDSSPMEKSDDVNIPSAVTSADVKKSKKGLVFALIIILLLAAGGGVGAYYFMNNGGDLNKDTQSDVEPTDEYSEYALVGNAINDFDISLLKFHNEKENKIYSPLSLKYALGMLADGANGTSKEQIENIIGTYEAKKYINSSNLSLANAMFIENGFKENILDTYTKDIGEKYNAEVVYDDFASAANVNNWVKSKTLNLIGDLIDDSQTSEINFMLINALAIDMEWKHWLQFAPGSENDSGEEQGVRYDVDYAHEKYSDSVGWYSSDSTIMFDGDKNTNGVTIGASINRYDILKDKGEEEIRKKVKEEYEKWEKEQTDLIGEDAKNDSFDIDEYIKELGSNYENVTVSTDFKYYVGDNTKVFAKELKEYGGNTLQYVAIMPTKDDLDKYIENVSADEINDLIGSLKDLSVKDSKDGVITHIQGTMPMFKYDYSLEPIEDLGKMGITDVFDKEKADLSNMTSKEDIYISEAIHKSTIDFSNEGIKAAAASAMIGLGDADRSYFDYEWEVPVEEVDLSFDKPFLFIIRDVKSGEVWFTGAVYEPIKVATE